MKKLTTLLILCVMALVAYDCEKVSLDDYQEFVMTTPDVGNLSFESLNATYLDNGCYVSAITDRKQGADILWLTLSFDKDTSIGNRTKLRSCSFGPFMNSPYADKMSGGEIYLKEKTEKVITLRFKDVCFTTDRGEYRLRGDLTFILTDN